jgi:plastocyanin
MRASLALAGLLLLLPSFSAGLEPGRIVGRATIKGVQKHPVVVFVPGLAGRVPRTAAERPVVDQKDRAFTPHVLPVPVGTAVEFRNGDPFKHNIFSPDGERYNLGTWEQGYSRTYTFKRPGVYRQLCNIHPEMLAYIVVLDTPAFALTDGEGNFEIRGIPAGQHILRVWGEKLTPAQLAHGVEATVSEAKVASVQIDLPP